MITVWVYSSLFLNTDQLHFAVALCCGKSGHFHWNHSGKFYGHFTCPFEFESKNAALHFISLVSDIQHIRCEIVEK